MKKLKDFLLKKKIFFAVITILLSVEFALQLAGVIAHLVNEGSWRVKSPNNTSTKTYKIMVLGESTSYGYLLKNRRKEAFPYLLASKLNEEKKDVEFQVINLSYPGQISDSIVQVFRKNYIKYRPDLVICQFGVNDIAVALNPFLGINFFGLTIPSIAINIKIIKLFVLGYFHYVHKKNFSKGQDGHFIFYNEDMGMGFNTRYLSNTYLNYKTVLNTLKKNNTKFMMISYFDAPSEVYDLLGRLQKEYDAPHVHLELKEDKSSTNLYAEDMWHPNARGHDLIANKIVNYMNQKSEYFFNGDF